MSAMDWFACASLSIFIWIGLALLVVGFRNIWYALASTRWPAVPGAVIGSDASTSSSRDPGGRTSTTFYQADITFSYQVNGKSCKTDRIHFGQIAGSADSTEADLIRLRYPVGAKVAVSYNPRNPSMAVARPGFHTDALWIPGAGLGFGLPGLMFVLMYLGMFKDFPVGGLAWRLFACVFMLLGAALLAPGLMNLWRARQSLSWPQAPGVMLPSQQVSTRLLYRYEVDGREYFSNVRRFGQIASSSDDWAAGAKVQVVYDPADPQTAALEPGIAQEGYYLPGGGAAFLLFGVAVFFALARRGV